MNEELSKLFEILTDINSDGSINLPEEKLKELKSKGYDKIKIMILGDSKNAAKELGYNTSMIEKIQNVQGLPVEVVINFLKSKGSVTSNEFNSRVKF
jgi:MoaA/NifB/PqqE/SkfB family radical SAM enzyme